MTDFIERETMIEAPIERVWSAIADHRRFGEWFKVALDQPFAMGQPSTGHITNPGYEHIRWDAEIVAIEAPAYFAYRWHPYAGKPDFDYSGEPTTLVEFRLSADGTDRTRLVVRESGFDALPPERREPSYRGNSRGWEQQVANIAAYVAG